MSHPYWQFFLAIESDLDTSLRYVELSESNFGTYSIEFAKILLSACSEVDVVCRVLAHSLDPESRPQSINAHRKLILRKYPKFHSIEVQIPRFGMTLTPWSSWNGSDNPDWWRSHNDVKHKRYKHFEEANLRNALYSVAGLFSLVLYLYRDDLERELLRPWPKLLDIEGRPGNLLLSGRYKLPDFV